MKIVGYWPKGHTPEAAAVYIGENFAKLMPLEEIKTQAAMVMQTNCDGMPPDRVEVVFGSDFDGIVPFGGLMTEVDAAEINAEMRRRNGG